MPALRRSLVGKLLVAELAVVVAGSATLAIVALLLGPTIFHRHVRDALGFVPPTVLHHLDEAFGQALALSLGLGIAAATGTALVVSLLVSNRIVRPLRDLAGAAEQVSLGDYDARVAVTGDDELTVLAHAFNEMAGSLASAEARRRRLLADVAHELRTPLATLDAYLEGLADGVVAAEPATWNLLRLETARLNRLSEDVAKVSRAEERQLDLCLRRTRPQAMIDEAAQAARPAFAAKGVVLEVSGDGHAPDVAVDRDRMTEVLVNLLDNALRHTPARGNVTLSATRDDGFALVSVTDTGEGLDPDELERIFERFYRVDPSRSRDQGGSGIGLTIARALVEAHGGRLWAESDGRGSGTRLICRLPAA
jgi:two-component system sensor histidine kinase BaeS